MNASGCPREEANSPGHYSRESVNTVYNYNNTGRGPTGTSAASGSSDVTLADVRRHSKTARFDKSNDQINSMVQSMGGGTTE